MVLKPRKRWVEKQDSDFEEYSVWSNLPDDLKRLASRSSPESVTYTYDYSTEKLSAYRPKYPVWKRLWIVLTLPAQLWWFRRRLSSARRKLSSNQMDSKYL